MSLFSKPRKQRKTKEQRARAKGRRSYKKGLEGEAKADPLLKRRGYRVHKTRTHSRSRAEFDRLATDKHGRTYGVEVKNTKQKVSSSVVRKLRKKVDKSGLLHGGIIVSKKGLSNAAAKEAEKLGVKAYTIKRKRRKKSSFSLF